MWALAVALLVAISAGAFATWRYRTPLLRRWRLRGGRVAPRSAVVLVHGLMGFDEIKVGQDAHEYFRGVRDRLVALGVNVHRVRLPMVASVATRARELATQVRAIDAKRVVLIAHSMGGLDARYAISELGLSDRVVALVTIGTPHHGTPVADIGSGVLDKIGARWLAERIGFSADALRDLTSSAAKAFNARVHDHARVFYASVVARAPEKVHPLLMPTHRWLRKRAGPNDGLVPLASQAWGETIATIEADHWASVGWADGFDAPALYVSIVRELRARGF